MKPFLFLGIAGALVVGAFVAGRTAGFRAPPETTAATAAAGEVVDAVASGTAERAIREARNLDLARLRSLAAPAAALDTALEQAPVEETPAATAARRAETDTRLAKELGTIPDEQRRLLLDFNDRAIELQRRLAGEFQRGNLTHEEYMRQIHEEMINQLTELNLLVADDQYRILTGLEPGVDPYDFMATGIGGAPGSEVEVAAIGGAP